MTGKRVLALGAVVALLVVGAPRREETKAAAADFLLRPKESVLFRANWGGWLALRDGPFTAKGVILVKTADAPTLRATGYFNDGTDMPFITLKPGTASQDATPVELSFDVYNRDPNAGWLVLRKGSEDLQTVDFSLQRVVDARVLAKPLMLATFLPGVFFIALHRVLRRKFSAAGRTGPNMGDTLRTGDAKWSFSESWASTITAVGAILGTVLASKDFLTEALSGLSLTGFVGLSLLFGFLVLFAPLMFSALQEDGKGTYGGLMFAGFITCAAAVGQIGTLTLMMHRGGLAVSWGAGVNVVSWLLLGFYAARSINDLVVPTWRTDFAATPGEGRRAPIL